MPAAATMEMEALPADQRPPRCRCRGSCLDWFRFGMLILVLADIAAGFTYAIIGSSGNPVFSASIDSVSGLELDPAKDLGRAPTLDPVFNITIRLSSGRRIDGRLDCLWPGTTVEVTYRSILLASRTVEQFCVGARETRDESVAAWGKGVSLPGFAMDALAADVRRGAEEFDVTVKIPNTRYLGSIVFCRARRVGDDHAVALRTPCDVSSADIVVNYPNTGSTQPGGTS